MARISETLRSRPVLLPALIFLLAFAVRGGLMVSEGVFTREKDALEYHTFAESVLHEGRYAGLYGHRATRMPGYPLFLAFQYATVGTSTTATLVLQSALGAATCVLLFLLAGELLKPPWPAVCGLAGALTYDMAAPCVQPTSECLYAFLLTAAFWALHRRAWRPPVRAAAAGLLLGAAYWTRPEGLVAAVVVLALAPLSLEGFGRRELALGLAGAALFAGLWTGRNFMVLGTFLPVSSTGNINKYYALLIPLQQTLPAPPEADDPPWELPELEREARYGRAYAALKARAPLPARMKAKLFNALSVMYPFLPEYDASYVFLIPFWLAGLLLAAARRELRPAALCAAALGGVFLFFGGPASRYRFSFSPLLVLLAAAGAGALYERAGSRRFLLLAAPWAALNGALWIWAPQARALALAVKSLFRG